MDNRNVSWAENQHVRKISEGSCDTEDWSNDAEKWKYEKCSFDMTGKKWPFKIKIENSYTITIFLPLFLIK